MHGFEAYRRNDAGVEVVPETRQEWDEWVSASKTRNWCIEDPLLDWLDRWGEAKGFEKDPDPADPRLDYTQFVFAQGHRFEEAVVQHLETLAEVYRVGEGRDLTLSLDAGRRTFEAMECGVPIIHQGVLRNPETKTFGAADLLIRSDVLAKLFPDALTPEEAEAGAPGIGADRWHYRVVDVKFTTLELNRHWGAGNKHLHYMAQVAIYTRALGRIQGYEPPTAYLLGRGWTKGSGKSKAESASCMSRLAPVDLYPSERMEQEPLSMAMRAVEWIREVRTNGGAWDPREEDCRAELLPDVRNGQNGPWSGAVKSLAEEREDVTVWWQVTAKRRDAVHANGIRRWTDPRFTAATAGLSGEQARVLDAMLEHNRTDGGLIAPVRMEAEVAMWGSPRPLEFFVDFETVGDMADDFSRIPEKGGQSLIFMVGCGHYEDGQFQFRCFITRDLTAEAEADMVEEWLEHMESTRRRLAPEVAQPLVFHWSGAETVSFNGLNSARTRNEVRSQAWVEPNWYDLLVKVVRAEPFLVRGVRGFGLKGVAKTLHQHGVIQAKWEEGVVDGLGAMMGAWVAADEVRERGGILPDTNLMKQVERYNKIDCQVMGEVLQVMRERAALQDG